MWTSHKGELKMDEIDKLLAQNPVTDPEVCRIYGYSGPEGNECNKECPYYKECKQWLWDIANLIKGLELHMSVISEN